MYPRRAALPRLHPTTPVVTTSASPPATTPAEEFVLANLALPAAAAGINAERRLADSLRRRRLLADQLESLDAEIEELVVKNICGGVDDTQHVEEYDGSLGVSRAFVAAHHRPVGQLQWRRLEGLFTAPGESPGNVSGRSWGSGCLVSRDLFLTAGHCFDSGEPGDRWRRPSRRSVPLPPREIATLMQVNFMFQKNASTGSLRPPQSFAVGELLEYRFRGVDYAVARLRADGQGRLPGDLYGWLRLAAGALRVGDMLCCIQHPGGEPKKVEAGPVLDLTPENIWYDSLDTRNESSGAPLLGPTGEIVGIHTRGGCLWSANSGVSAGAVRAASSLFA